MHQEQEQASHQVRVLVVDGHPTFLHAAQSMLSADPRIVWMMGVQSGREAIEQITSRTPDLVVMEISLPDGNGFEVGRAIKTVTSGVCVVLMTIYETDMYSQAVVSAGLDRVIDKRDFSAAVGIVVDRLCAVSQEFRLGVRQASGHAFDSGREPT